MTKKPTPRKPTDATMRNVRANVTRTRSLAQRVRQLEIQVKAIRTALGLPLKGVL